MRRRTDEQTALTAEYALYLVDIRGVEFALFELTHLSSSIQVTDLPTGRSNFQ